MKKHLNMLYIDTAAMGVSSLLPALTRVGKNMWCTVLMEAVMFGQLTMEDHEVNILAFKGLTRKNEAISGDVCISCCHGLSRGWERPRQMVM